MESLKESITRADLKRLLMRQIAIFNGLNASALDQPKVYAQYNTLVEGLLATIGRKGLMND